MFLHLAHGIIRRPLTTVIAWAVLAVSGVGLAIFGVTGEGLFDRVNSGAPLAADSDSAVADQIIEEGAGASQSVTMAVSGVDLDDRDKLAQIVGPIADIRSDLVKTKGIAVRQADQYPMVIDPLNPSYCLSQPTDPATEPGANPPADAVIDPESVEAAQCALSIPGVQGLIAQDRDGFLMTAEVAKNLGETEEDEAVRAIIARLDKAAVDLPKAIKGVKVVVGGEHLILTEIVADMKHDLEVGELISLPVALIVMVLVFAGFLAAAMPVVGAVASILTCMGAVFGFTYLTDIHTSVINVISLVGIGLSIDYGLLIVSRFREEIRRAQVDGIGGIGGDDGGGDADGAAARSTRRGRGQAAVKAAVTTTVETAGRTVFYSALTIAVCVAGLIAFEPSILRTFGLASLTVVLLALGTATTLVPALLVLTGRWLTKPSLISRIPGLSYIYKKASDVSPDTGIFSKLANAVQRRPWWVMGGVLVVMVVLAWPIIGIELRNSTVDLLPASSPQRAFLDELEANYPLSNADAIEVVSLGSPEETEAFARDELGSIEGTELAKGLDGAAITDHDSYVSITLGVTGEDPEGPQARTAVERIREKVPNGFEVHVTGPAARLLDFEDQLAAGAPTALIIVVVATFILLFLFTGSVLIPIKALISNALSLLACLGVVTWIFQGGHFAGLLGFTAVSGIESYILVLLLIFGFGLAMDYEVFLISRIKESWDSNLDPRLSVSEGLQHSGRIITSAALIIVMVFLGFAAGRLVVIKEIGLGLALAVALDATLVRMLLVPATMSVLGKWNWWAPRPLARLHKRLGLSH